MTTTAPHIRLHGTRNTILVLGLLLLLGAASQAAATITPEPGLTTRVTAITITYKAHNGTCQHAEVLLPAWYTRHNNPPLPLVISPHGRGGKGSSNAKFWGTLPTTGGFAVVNPDGMGRRLDRISYGYRGQIDDLARMPDIVTKALPWVHLDRDRIFALGSSMGGQETLLLVARHPKLARRRRRDGLRHRHGPPLRPARAAARSARCSQSNMRTELGGSPATAPKAFASRSPLSQARRIARSGVPLQIWWSTKDRIVIDQQHQSGDALRYAPPARPVRPAEGVHRDLAPLHRDALHLSSAARADRVRAPARRLRGPAGERPRRRSSRRSPSEQPDV